MVIWNLEFLYCLEFGYWPRHCGEPTLRAEGVAGSEAISLALALKIVRMDY